MEPTVTQPLRAVVIGAGFAGEGHTRALRHCGVDVVAICARQPEVVGSVADRLGIPEASTDWRSTLQRVKPEIVAIATPASLRLEPIELACALGCHVYCDKPLAVTAPEAKRILEVVESSGIKHAFAATMRYDPGVAYLAELVRDGAIGRLLEVEYSRTFHFPSPHPWTWADTVSGGGVFGSNMPHMLGIVERATGGKLRRVTGEARVYHHRQPLVREIHDVREVFKYALPLTDVEGLEWREADAENAVTALFRLQTASGDVALTFRWTTLTAAPWPVSGMSLFGEQGTLVADGYTSYSLYRVTDAEGNRSELPVPERFQRSLPDLGNDVLNKWAALARDFVADIRGESHEPYLTLRDGLRYQEAIDAIRAGDGWHDLPL